MTLILHEFMIGASHLFSGMLKWESRCDSAAFADYTTLEDYICFEMRIVVSSTSFCDMRGSIGFLALATRSADYGPIRLDDILFQETPFVNYKSTSKCQKHRKATRYPFSVESDLISQSAHHLPPC
jgi:hypothetical protein